MLKSAIFALLSTVALGAPAAIQQSGYFKATYSQTPVSGSGGSFTLQASISACPGPFPDAFAFHVQDSTRSLCLNYGSGIMRFETAGTSFNPTSLTHGQWDYMDGLEMLLAAAQELQNSELVAFFQAALSEQLSNINGVVAPAQRLPATIEKRSSHSVSFKIYANQPLELVAEFQDKSGKNVYGNQRKAVAKGIQTVNLDMVAPPIIGPFRLAFAVVSPGNDLLHYVDIGSYNVTVFRNEE